MSLAVTLLTKSAEEIAREIGGGKPGSETEYTRVILLNYKLQLQLIKTNRHLVIITFVLFVATVIIAYTT